MEKQSTTLLEAQAVNAVAGSFSIDIFPGPGVGDFWEVDWAAMAGFDGSGAAVNADLTSGLFMVPQNTAPIVHATLATFGDLAGHIFIPLTDSFIAQDGAAGNRHIHAETNQPFTVPGGYTIRAVWNNIALVQPGVGAILRVQAMIRERKVCI